MAGRIAAAAERIGLDAEPIVQAFLLGEAHRLAVLADDHHPDYLHGGRAAVILLDDARCGNAVAVAAATAADSRDARLRVPAPELARAAGAEAAAAAAEIPAPAEAGDALLEHLVTASHASRLAALAERLDHARHLHLRAPEEWRPFHELMVQAYLPAAERTDPTLARRIGWWCGMFEDRFLTGRLIP
jgi:hypothetical protein